MITGPGYKGIEPGDVVQFDPQKLNLNPTRYNPADYCAFGLVAEVHPHGVTVHFRIAAEAGAELRSGVWRYENIERVGRAPYAKSGEEDAA